MKAMTFREAAEAGAEHLKSLGPTAPPAYAVISFLKTVLNCLEPSPSTETFGRELLGTPEAHQGIIKGVEVFTAKAGWIGIKVNLQSIHNTRLYSVVYWPPIEYVNDIYVSPDELSCEIAPGEKLSPRYRYTAVISNRNKDADLQQLKAIASNAGKTAMDVKVPVTDFGSLVKAFDDLLVDVPVVFVFDGLHVLRIRDGETANNPKMYRKLKRMWREK